MTGQTSGELAIASQAAVDVQAPELRVSGNMSVAGTLRAGKLLDLSAPAVQTSDLSADTLSTTGSVGLGTAAGSYRLTVKDNSDRHIRLENGAEVGLIRLTGDGALDLWAHGGDPIIFRRGSGAGTESARIDAHGNFGVGTGTSLITGGPSGTANLPYGSGPTFQVGSGLFVKNHRVIFRSYASSPSAQIAAMTFPWSGSCKVDIVVAGYVTGVNNYNSMRSFFVSRWPNTASAVQVDAFNSKSNGGQKISYDFGGTADTVFFVVGGETGAYTYFDVTLFAMCSAMESGGASAAVTVQFGLPDSAIGR